MALVPKNRPVLIWTQNRRIRACNNKLLLLFRNLYFPKFRGITKHVNASAEYSIQLSNFNSIYFRWLVFISSLSAFKGKPSLQTIFWHKLTYRTLQFYKLRCTLMFWKLYNKANPVLVWKKKVFLYLVRDRP